MKEDKLNKILNESIDKVLSERQNKLVNKILKEELEKYIIKEEEDTDQKRKSVMASLKQQGIKKSELAYALWPNSDPDTARSLLSRKEKNGEWHFDEEEINKLYQLIRKI